MIFRNLRVFVTEKIFIFEKNQRFFSVESSSISMKRQFPASFTYSYNENLPSKGSIFREKVSLFEISYRNSTTKSDTFGRSEILGFG